MVKTKTRIIYRNFSTEQVNISGTGLLPPITTLRMVDNGYSLTPGLDSAVASNLDDIWPKGAIVAYEEAPDVDDYD